MCRVWRHVHAVQIVCTHMRYMKISRLHDRSTPVRGAVVCLYCGCLSVKQQTLSMESWLGKGLSVPRVLFLLCCGKLRSYQSASRVRGHPSWLAGFTARSRSVSVLWRGVNYSGKQPLLAWPAWTQPCCLGSALQQAACVHQRSHVSCFCGACDLHVHEGCGGGGWHVQLVLDSHSPLQQREWGGGTSNIQPDPVALVITEGEK